MVQFPFPVLRLLLCLVFSSATVAVSQTIYISEFMASNQDALTDEDGNTSDWLELFNSGTTPIDLDGWYLTDDAALLTKWQIPGVTLNGGQFIVIFASNKNRRDPANELHTNFKLSASGDHLALVRPDGTTVEHDYGASYPAQITDVSYGLGMSGGTSVLLEHGDGLRYKVPSDDSDDVDDGLNPNPWIATGFNDASWTAGSLGIGYARVEPDAYDPLILTDVESLMDGNHPTIYVRCEFNVADPSAIQGLILKMKFEDGFVAYLNGQPESVAASNAPSSTVLDWESTAQGTRNDSEALQFQDFVIADPPLVTGTNVLSIHGLNASSSSSDLLIAPELVASTDAALNGSTNYFTTPTPDGTNSDASNFPGPLISGVPKTLTPPNVGGTGNMVIADSAAEFSGNQGQDGWFYGYHDVTNDSSGAGYDESTDFTQFPGGASAGAWSDTNHWDGSIWDFNPIGSGTGNPPWTSLGATAVHPNDSNPGQEHYVVRRWVSDVAGAYRITGSFNNGSTSGDGTTGRVYHDGVQIFSAITNGNSQSVNVAANLSIGDKIDFVVDTGPADADGSDGTNTSFQIVQGGGGGGATINIPITAKVQPTLEPLANVILKHRVMYGAEIDVTMVDDSSGDDAVSGDGIYTGTISTNALTAGGMLRWRVVATDTMGNATSFPSFPDPLDSPEYCGTIAEDASTSTSQLPVLHWFTANPSAANDRSGTRSSVYFLGEFYDNILTDLHGQSTSGFPKKSYDLDFNAGDRFRWKDGERKVKDLNLLTNWADKSKVRNTLAYEVLRDTGAPYHFAFAVRVQQNGAFFNTADMVEDGDDRLLERNGLDPVGSFYKIYNRLDSTSGAAKKTRKDEGSADLQALINGLGQSADAKIRYGYDNVNIPAAVNYHAAIAIYCNQDHGHKNYYVYRDTEGTREWMPIAWDVDLSFGRNWQSGYFVDNLNGATNTFTPGSSNRLYTLIYNTPKLREMYNRRIKSVADKILQAPGTVNGKLEQRVNELLAQIDPPGVVSDADLDYNKWGSWGNNNNAAQASQRLIDEFLDKSGGTDRRDYIYTQQSATIPMSQPAMAPVEITMGEFNPSSGNQDEEYFMLSHSNSYATDISGWRLDGAVRMAIPAGTVIPTGMTLYIGRDAVSFRARSTSPKGDEKRFLISGYGGQLSARGETIELYDDLDNLIDTLAYTGNPTDMQEWLRITELMFNPADPSASELASDPNLTASDFEFVELRNTGPSSLDISGAQFVTGITFTFLASTTLAPGESILVVSNQSAFDLRYGNTLNVVGEYVGQLGNGGEEIQLIDEVGENILEFVFADDWFWPTDGAGYSLVVRDATDPFTNWEQPSHWAISADEGGSPGVTDTEFSTLFSIWKQSVFTPGELADPLISGDLADADGDDLNTVAEYGLALDPNKPDGIGTPTAGVETIGLDGYLSLTFMRQRRPADLEYAIQVGSDLVGWTEAALPVGNPTDHGDGTETLTFRDTQKMVDSLRRFIRVQMVLTPAP
ncbi:MAG: hypothetical protein ACI9MB_000670 [Verrucomicrobiales bacterium]|jgi:hypothetical protein